MYSLGKANCILSLMIYSQVHEVDVRQAGRCLIGLTHQKAKPQTKQWKTSNETHDSVNHQQYYAAPQYALRPAAWFWLLRPN